MGGVFVVRKIREFRDAEEEWKMRWKEDREGRRLRELEMENSF